MNTNSVHKVSNGECAWKVAKQNLQSANKKVTNQQIIEEMNRLAKLNGCNSIEDFNKKFFSSTGKKFLLEEKTPVQKNTPAPEKSPPAAKKELPDTTQQNDSIRVTLPHQPNKPDSIKVEQPNKNDTIQQKPPVQKLTPKEQEIDRINKMDNDTDRIIEYNKQNYKYEYYGIVDKKTCKLNIYDKDGNVVKTFPVGVGKTKGDNLSSGFMSDDYTNKESGRYTTPGECTLDAYKTYHEKDYISQKDGKIKVMALKGDNRGEDSGQISIHMVPNSLQYRNKAIKSETAADNRMSYGCVNLLEEDYDEMTKYLGEGNKIYILPEEKGNKLQLEKQADGSYRFEQQYHKDQKREKSKEEACNVKYDVRPENAPKVIAEKERQLAMEKFKNTIMNSLQNFFG